MSTKVRNHLSLRIVWASDPDPVYPYSARVSGERLVVRVNDFPSDHLYTLIVNDEEFAHFDDWPDAWVRPCG